ncbi:MAG: hypothetical protein Aurels2KO_02570 [Aureliella sp.]
MSKVRASAYAQAEPDELTIRDHLARDRTTLANERTFLSYIRTAFGFAAAGGTLIKLFPTEQSSQILGGGLLAAGAIILIVGIWRFTVVRIQLRRIILPK